MGKSTSSTGVQEIQKILVDYAKQETVDPLKTLGRYIGFGLVGSLFVSLGVFFLSLGVLRFSQSLDVFDGSSWSSVFPYLFTTCFLVVALLVLFMSLSRAKKNVRSKERYS